jgi:hypothetical protein
MHGVVVVGEAERGCGGAPRAMGKHTQTSNSRHATCIPLLCIVRLSPSSFKVRLALATRNAHLQLPIALLQLQLPLHEGPRGTRP